MLVLLPVGVVVVLMPVPFVAGGINLLFGAVSTHEE